MKSLKAVQLFLALSLTTTVVACGTARNTDSGVSEPASPPATMTHGGGEAATVENTDIDYLATLGLMQGHLLVAKELMDAGQYEQAEPHIGHPIEELYAEIADQLTQRQVPDFKPDLIKLHDLIKSAPSSPETGKAYAAASAAIARAINAVPASQRQSPEVVLASINQILKTAAQEYEAAIANGKIVETIEYQDSRGFVLYAEQMYQEIAPRLSQERPDDHKAIMVAFSELKLAWPSPNPPENLVKTPSEVNSLISNIN